MLQLVRVGMLATALTVLRRSFRTTTYTTHVPRNDADRTVRGVALSPVILSQWRQDAGPTSSTDPLAGKPPRRVGISESEVGGNAADPKRFLIIGAGPAGIAVLQQIQDLKERGVPTPEVVCYEQQAEAGGVCDPSPPRLPPHRYFPRSAAAAPSSCHLSCRATLQPADALAIGTAVLYSGHHLRTLGPSPHTHTHKRTSPHVRNTAFTGA